MILAMTLWCRELEFVEVESGAWERGQARLYVSLGGFLLVQRLHDSHE